MIALVAICFALGAAIAWMVVEAHRAPTGYEDAEGFHLGADPDGLPAHFEWASRPRLSLHDGGLD